MSDFPRNRLEPTRLPLSTTLYGEHIIWPWQLLFYNFTAIFLTQFPKTVFFKTFRMLLISAPSDFRKFPNFIRETEIGFSSNCLVRGKFCPLAKCEYRSKHGIIKLDHGKDFVRF